MNEPKLEVMDETSTLDWNKFFTKKRPDPKLIAAKQRRRFNGSFTEYQIEGRSEPQYLLDTEYCYPGSNVWVVCVGVNQNGNKKYKVVMVSVSGKKEVSVVWGYGVKNHDPKENKLFNLGTAKRMAGRFAQQYQPLLALGIVKEGEDGIVREHFVQKNQQKK